jgi:thiol-disulfide isomerase/thioredoxin
MSVTRINRKNLIQILEGKTNGSHEVVIKLYGTNCHLCHALKDLFVDISDQYDDLHFYAFNMEDGKGLEKKYGFEGVPSICYVRTGGMKPVVRFLEEPKKPHKETWYHPTGIRIFIDKSRI